MFVSVDGKSQEVTEIFAGGSDGKAHKITELFGSVNGVAKRIYSIEKETNAFDQFTWAEIKQLANEGKLLEHFKQFDKVKIKLKEPIRQNVTIVGTGTIELMQNEIMFQIVELTETKMRLMSPRANALLGDSDIYIENTVNYPAPDNWKNFANSYESGGRATGLISAAWGLSRAYQKLKALDNAFPDDFREVLSVVARPLISWTKNAISGGDVLTYDEDMRVTQVSDDIFKKGTIDTSNPECFMPVVASSYYPTSVSEFTYYINLPRELDTYEQRRKFVKQFYRYIALFDYKLDRDLINAGVYEYYYQRTVADSAYASCYFGKGIVSNDEYQEYQGCGICEKKKIMSNNSIYGEAIFPEVVIEADA